MAVALALLAALSWGISNFVAGVKSRTTSAVAITAWMFLVGGAMSLALALVREDPPSTRTIVAALAIGAISAYGVTAFFHALAIGVIGTIAPTAAAGTAIPVIAGLVKGERPTAGQIAGVLLVIAGVIAMARFSGASDGRAREPRLAMILAITSMASLGMYYVVADEVHDGRHLWFAAIGQLAAALPLFAGIALGRVAAPPRSMLPSLVLVGAINGAGWVFSILAIDRGLLAIVSVLIALYPAVTVMLATVVLREPLSRAQTVSGMVIFLGVIAIVALG